MAYFTVKRLEITLDKNHVKHQSRINWGTFRHIFESRSPCTKF